MLKINLVFLLLLGLSEVNAQLTDLVVTTKGDSIACSITGITDTTLQISMKNKGEYVVTYISLKEVASYRFSAWKYKTNNSTLSGEARPKTYTDTILKNSFSVEMGGTGVFFSANYERRLQLSPELAIAPRVGIGSAVIFHNIVLEINCIAGRHHAFETGFGVGLEGGLTPYWYSLRAGYRYTKKLAFIRIAPLLMISPSESSTDRYGLWGNLGLGICF